MAHPEVIEEAYQKGQDQKAAKALAAAQGAISQRLGQLEHDPRDFVANPQGKVTVVEFFDYRCPYCKAAQPDLMKLIAHDKDVRVVFKELPNLDNEVKPGVSKRDALAAIASQASGKYRQIHNALMGTRAIDDPDIARALTANGIDPATTVKPTPENGRHIRDVRDLAVAIGTQRQPHRRGRRQPSSPATAWTSWPSPSNRRAGAAKIASGPRQQGSVS